MVVTLVTTMARFRRNQGLRPIHSIKHVIDVQLGLTAGTQVNTNLVNTIDAPTLANPTSVETGCKISSIYLNVEGYQTSATGGALSNFYMIVVKNQGGNTASIAANAVGVDDNKRFVIHQEMKMRHNTDNGNPRTLFVGVLRIPRGYQRFGINDLLQVGLLTPAGTMDMCIQCIYKELR